MTKTKRVFAEIIDTSPAPLTVADLLTEAAKRGLRANKTTAYRFLTTAMSAGEVSEVDFGDGVKRYEHTHGTHHHHAVCMNCDAVTDVEIEPELERIARSIETKSGFTVERHLVEFFGRCKACV